MDISNSTDSTLSIAAQGGVAFVMASFLKEALIAMVPYLILAIVLILVDLYFGVSAALKRGEQVRVSRMIRRTVGKTFEYLCWVTLSASLSVAFHFPGLQYVILGLVAGNELISVISNWAFIHGKKIKGLNLMKIFGDRGGVDLSGVTVEDVEPKEKEGENGNNQ